MLPPRIVLARAAIVSIAVAGFAAALAGHAQRPVRSRAVDAAAHAVG